MALCQDRFAFSAQQHVVNPLNQQLTQLKLGKAVDKTYIGKKSKGFDFLGYHFSDSKLAVSKKTLNNYVGKIAQLFEQKHSRHERPALLAAYRQRWLRWVTAGFSADTRCNIVIGDLDGDDGAVSSTSRLLRH